MQDRQNAIYQYIKDRGDVTIVELVEKFNQWSEMTIRRDLAKLAAKKSIILTRGGAKYLPAKSGVLKDKFPLFALTSVTGLY